MIYRFLYYLVGCALRVFYRKIYISGAENLKKNTAYILASNHPAGFVEPLIMACFLPRDLYFMTRGDLFENKFYNYIFTATHQIPIFRFRDGFSNLRNNHHSISKAVETLKENKALLIFVEGTTSYQFYTRPLQKGFARMGFQALSEYPDLDIAVVPVGITFSQIEKMGGDVILNLGHPINVRTYFTSEKTASNKGMNALIDDTYQSMKKLMLAESDEIEDGKIKSAWFAATKEDKSFFPRIIYSNDFFSKVKSSIDKENSISLPFVFGKKQKWIHILWILGLPSLIFTCLPRWLANYYKINKVKKLEFKMPVALAVGLISYVILILLTTLSVGYIFGITKAIFLVLIIIVSGYFHLWSWENSQKN